MVLDTFCETKGLKIGRFVEDAILDKLEELEDSADLRKIRQGSFRPFEDIIQELKKSGKL